MSNHEHRGSAGWLVRLVERQKREILDPEDENILWDRISKANSKHERARRTVRLGAISSTVAASVAAIVIGWYSLNWPETDTEPDYAAIMCSTSQEDLTSSDIQLVISAERKISLDGKYAEMDYRRDGDIIVNGEKLEITEKETEDPCLNRLIVPYGKRSQLTLADGTKMWVNSGTTVIYPALFAPGKREIFVEGEVFLEVARNENVPFFVKTREMSVEVLGTSFNVSTLDRDSVSEVVLVNGKVEVTICRGEKSRLAPGQLFSYDASTSRSDVREVDVSNYIAWKDGYYQFRGQSLDVVLQRVEKFYALDMEWDEGMMEITCSGKLDFTDDPAVVLKALTKAAPVGFEKKGEKIRVYVKP